MKNAHLCLSLGYAEKSIPAPEKSTSAQMQGTSADKYAITCPDS